MSHQRSAIAPVDRASATVAVDLLTRFFAEEAFGGSRAGIERTLDAMLADPNHWAALARTGAGEPVGVVTATTMLYVEWGRLGEIGDLYVLPAHRGKGVARSLVGAATTWCQGVGCSAVSVIVTPEGQAVHGVTSFYEGLGFRATGRTMLVLDPGSPPG